MHPSSRDLGDLAKNARRSGQISKITRAATGVVLAGALVLLTACTDGGPGSLLEGDGGVATTGVVKVAPDDRKDPPSIAGRTLEGDELDVADLRGDVVVVNFWGSWCAPCRTETPALVRTAKAFEKDGVEFVGINTRDSDDKARAFARSVGKGYPSIVDPDGEVQLALREHVPPTSVPSTVVLDREGRVAVTVVGPVTQESLTEVLQPVVDEAKEGAPDVKGTALDGSTIDTEAYRGEVVALHVWGSWVAPSRKDIGALGKIRAAHHGQPVRFVGVDTLDDLQHGRALVRLNRPGFRSVVDADGSIARGLAQRAGFDESSVPATYLLGADGALVDALPGPVEPDALTAAIARAVEGV